MIKRQRHKPRIDIDACAICGATDQDILEQKADPQFCRLPDNPALVGRVWPGTFPTRVIQGPRKP